MMTKIEAYRIVLNDLKEVPMFAGSYDAVNGNKHFMYGISAVMEFIADKAEDATFEDFFMKNFEKSIDKLNKM